MAAKDCAFPPSLPPSLPPSSLASPFSVSASYGPSQVLVFSWASLTWIQETLRVTFRLGLLQSTRWGTKHVMTPSQSKHWSGGCRVWQTCSATPVMSYIHIRCTSIHIMHSTFSVHHPFQFLSYNSFMNASIGLVVWLVGLLLVKEVFCHTINKVVEADLKLVKLQSNAVWLKKVWVRVAVYRLLFQLLGTGYWTCDLCE